jgi:hypothetical protein
MNTEKHNQGQKAPGQQQPQNPIKQPDQKDNKERNGSGQDMTGGDVNKRREGQSGPGAPGTPMDHTEKKQQ